MRPKANINIGDRYGRLTIVREVGKRGIYRFFECRCDCGTVKTYALYNLRKGTTKSCGCLRAEVHNAPHPYKQNENSPYTDTRLYNIWKGMRKRCCNPNCRAYRWYGGRGIYVCQEWQRYLNFHNWAIQNGYSSDLTIDRIDVNGNYEPSNCRWITIQEQQKNKRK